MKKIIIISLSVIIVVVIYITLNKKNKESTKPREQIEKQANDSEFANSEEIIPPEFPDVYDLSTLTIDSKLKPVKLNIPDSLKWNSPEINISAAIPLSVKLCDLFLLINNAKKDMFYRANGGKYTFKNIKLNEGINKIEIFYRIRQKRSRAAISIIKRE